jgi:membrane-bound lytic murein transglycosylase D
MCGFKNNMKVDRPTILVRIVALGAFSACIASPAFGAELTRPAGLERDISFWRTVFTEVTSEQALVHDNRRLDVIYELVPVPADVGSAKARRISEQSRGKYKRILKTLANGKRKGLTSEEARVLALWPADVTNDELRHAAKRIRWQQGLADRFHAGLIRSGRWQPYIRVQLREHGVPEQLAALPHVESSFNPAARSHVGAVGLWQFTRPTGRRFMQIDHVVDERRDPFRSSEAAARLLSYNYAILDSWPLAITAYNHGVAGMRRAVKKMGTDDIETIVRGYSGRTFGFASRNFYVAFLAAAETERDAEKYFGPLKKQPPRQYIMLSLPDYIPVNALQRGFGVSLDTLRVNNPALMNPVWSGTKHVPRGFELRLPDDAVDIAPSAVLARIPDADRYAEQTPDLYHKVRRGDSLSVIAARYRTSVRELVALNGLKSRNRIRAGQVLRLPYSGPVLASAIPKDAETYVVQRGDTVARIADRAGTSERDLLALNALPDRNRIYPGQQLILRGTAPVAAVAELSPAEPGVEESAVVAANTQAAPPPEPAQQPEPETQSEPEQETLVADTSPGSAADETVSEATDALALLADPSDYLVAADDTIEVQAAETLGHYADWLEIRTQRLRDLNGLSFRQPLVIGRRLGLDFSRVDANTFAARRTAHHRELQEAFFTQYRITETTVHRLRRGESVWLLTQQRYKVPVWLVRQYNPDLDFDRVNPGIEIVFPRVEQLTGTAERNRALADASSKGQF